MNRMLALSEVHSNFVCGVFFDVCLNADKLVNEFVLR